MIDTDITCAAQKNGGQEGDAAVAATAAAAAAAAAAAERAAVAAEAAKEGDGQKTFELKKNTPEYIFIYRAHIGR